MFRFSGKGKIMSKRIPRGFLAAALTFLSVVWTGVLAARDVPARNTILVYSDPGRDWPAGSFTYYLSYVDKDGVPKDWLFDGFLFTAINTPTGHNFWDGKAGPADWNWWAGRIFEKDGQLDSLDHDTGRLAEALGPTAPKRVIISIPRPPLQGSESEKAAVVRDFVGQCVRSYESKKYKNVVLDGFYWSYETGEGIEGELINGLAENLHGRGLRLYWIPADVSHENRIHLERWKKGEVQFDEVWLQPNFFWAERNATFAAQDLDDTVSFARTVGAAVEIEFDHGVYASGWRLGRFTHYLISAEVYGYRDGPLTYYDGYKGYINCGESHDPVQRAIYDDLDWFTRGRYLPKPMTYPCRLREKGEEENRSAQPRIGFWLEKGTSPAAMSLVEPDPAKDYLVILRSEGGSGGRLEVSVEGRWVDLEKTGKGDRAGMEWFRLPRSIIQKNWTPGKPLVLSMRWAGGKLITAWARPDDFVFRHLKGYQPMETEMGLKIEGRVYILTGAADDSGIGLRLAGLTGKNRGFRLVSGRTRGESPAAEPAGTSERTVWLRAEPDGGGNIAIEIDPGVEVLELWAFPADDRLHLRPGSCGDTCLALHVPGVSLVPDGRWRLGGDYGRNHRIAADGAGLRVSAPRMFKGWTLTLLLDATGSVPIGLENGKEGRILATPGPGAGQRISIALEPGDHTIQFKSGIALHDAWLEHR